MNFVTLIHGYSHLMSLEIIARHWKLRRFQENQINLNGFLKKQTSGIYRGTFKTESHEPSCGIIPKT